MIVTILTLMFIGRVIRLNLTITTHNILVRYRFLFPILMLVSVFFLLHLQIALILLATSFIIYAGPAVTHRIIKKLEKKLERGERIQKIFQYEALKISSASRQEEIETAHKHILRLRMLDKDLQTAIKISQLIKKIIFIIVIISLIAAFLLSLKWLATDSLNFF
ncbi:MAG: hypothetical protein PHG95_02900 [Patescibacteria group bacterium]|nr:hypothetical protein [Patescibacteria group bacterium]